MIFFLILVSGIAHCYCYASPKLVFSLTDLVQFNCPHPVSDGLLHISTPESSRFGKGLIQGSKIQGEQGAGSIIFPSFPINSAACLTSDAHL